MADLYYYETGYFTPENYHGYLADAQADLREYAEDYFAEDYTFGGARATLSCSASKVKAAAAALASTSAVSVVIGAIKSSSATLSSAFTQFSAISHIEGADLFAMSNAALAADVARIRDNNIQATSAFSIAIDGARIRYVSSEEDSAFTLNADNLRVRFSEAAIDAAFSLAASADRIRNADTALTVSTSVTADLTLQPGTSVDASGTWTSQFDIDASGTRKANIIDNDVTVTTNLSAAGNRIRFGTGNLESQINSFNNVSLVANGQADLTSTTSLTSTISHIEGADLQAFNTASLTADITRYAGATSDLTATATQSTTALRTKQLASNASSNFNLSVTASNTIEFNAALNSTAAVTAIISHIEGADLQAFNTATLSAIATITKTTNVTLVSNFALALAIGNIKQAASALNLTASQSTTALRIQKSTVTLESSSTIVVVVNIANRRPRQITAVGSPTFSSSIKKYGSHSLAISSSTSQYLTIPATADTFDGFSVWVYASGTAGQYAPIFSRNPNTGASEWFYLGDFSGSNCKVLRGGASLANNVAYYWNANVAQNTWVHLHYKKSTGQLWINGTLRGTSTDIGFSVPGSFITATDESRIGYYSNNKVGIYLDDLVIFNSTAPNGGTVPTAEYTVDSQTGIFGLFHFNNDYVDDMTIVAQGAAALTSSSTITAQPDNRTREGSASLTAFATELVAIGRIRPQVADLTVTTALTVTSTKGLFATADLTSTTALTATVLDLDLAQAALSSAFTVSATVTRNRFASSALTSTLSLVVNADNPELRMYYGAGNTSGYITSTSDTNTLRSSFTNRASYDGSQQGYVPNYGWDPVYLNFWIKLGANLQDVSIDNYAIVLLYSTTGSSTSGRNVTLYKTSYGGTSRYRLHVEFVENVAIPVYSVGGLSGPVGPGETIDYFTKYQITRSNTYDYILPIGIDLTQWHNITIPLDEGWISPSDGDTGYHAAYITNNPPTRVRAYCDGTLLDTYLNPGPTLPPSNYGYGFIQTVRTAPIGGVWGSPSNPVDVYLDQIWLKTPTYNSATDQYTIPPESDFYVNGGQTLIPRTTGTTPSGITPDVWLPFFSLNDQASASPTWNYTKTNFVTFGRIVFGGASLASTVAVSAQATKVIKTTASLTATITASITGRRLRLASSTQQVTAVLASTAIKVSRAQSALNVTASQSVTYKRFRTTSVALQSTATLTANAIKVTVTQASLASQFSQTTNNIRTRGLISSQEAVATQVSNAIKTSSASASLTALYTELAIAIKTGQAVLAMDTNATLAATVSKFPGAQANLTSQAVVTCNLTRAQYAAAAVSSNFTQLADTDYLRPAGANLTAQVTVQAQVKRIRGVTCTATTAVTVVATTNNSRKRGAVANLQVQAVLTSNNQIVRLATANLTSAFTIPLAYVLTVVRFTASLTAFNTQLTATDVFNIDPYLQLLINKETRFLKVDAESRLLTIDQENRVNIIKGYKPS